MGLWTNQVYCIDCMDGMAMLDNKSVDICITDPPYDVNYNEKSKHLIKLDKSGIKQIKRDSNYIKFNIDYDKFSKQLFRIMKNNTHIYIFSADKQISKWYNAMINAGFKFNNYLIWIKNSQTFDLTFGLKYAYKAEFCIFFRKGIKKLSRIGLNNVFKYNISNNLKHPCEKSINMIQELLKNSSKEGDLMLDCFAGGGSHLIASKNTNRKYIGFEISHEYCKLINKRLSQKNINSFSNLTHFQ